VASAAGLAHFDLYPFILLNLAFSLQAAYAAPLILLAQTRQADRDKAHADADAMHRETLAAGETDKVREFAFELSGYVTGAWSVRLTDLLVRAAVPHYVELAILALLLDGVLTLCEGWALYRRFTWAPWLVVIATGSLLPFEMLELVRRLRTGRLLTLFANLAIVTYLGVRAAREVRTRQATH
jgi:uncharacterized membrane protein (DUF2068 family)